MAHVTTEALDELIEQLENCISILGSSRDVMSEEMRRASSAWSDGNFEKCRSLVNIYAKECNTSIEVLDPILRKLVTIKSIVTEYNG